MTLTELRYIVTLAQEEHFGRAAERCFVSQPTLSIAVKKLEEELGVALFERSKSRVSATDLGKQVVAQAHAVLEQASKIKEIASTGKDQLGAPLNVGAIYTIGPFLFPHFIPELKRIAPNMPLYVEEAYTTSIRQKLRNGDLDAVIVALPFEEPDVVTRVLYDEPFVVVMRQDHPLVENESITPEQLVEHEVLLLGEGHCFRDQVLEAIPNLKPSFEDRGGMRAMKQGSSLETLRHMVASGLGVTVLPLSAAAFNQYGENILTHRPFSDASIQRTVVMAWRASFPRHKAIDVLGQAINQCGLV